MATASVLQALRPGVYALSISNVYGGTFRCMSKVAAQLQGLEVTFLDFDKASDTEVVSAVRENTKASVPCTFSEFRPRADAAHTQLVWIETPMNSTLRLPDLPCVTALLQRTFPPATRPLVLVDATFLSPFYISPLAAPVHADIALHSLTKYINGHSDVLMGAVVLPAGPHADVLHTRLRARVRAECARCGARRVRRVARVARGEDARAAHARARAQHDAGHACSGAVGTWRR